MSETAFVPEGNESSEAAESSAPAERTFTQADLNKIAANEKRSGSKAGREAAISELLERTGAESIDDVLSSYEEYKSVQSVTETEADKARKRAERLEQRAKSAEERYTNTLREFALRDALRDEGINSERLPLALKVAEMSALEVDGDGKVAGVEDVVSAVREASPEWFATEQRQRMNAPQTQGTGIARPSDSDDPEVVKRNFIDNLLLNR